MEGISLGGTMVMSKRLLKLKDQLGLYYAFSKIWIFCLKTLHISVHRDLNVATRSVDFLPSASQ